MQQHTGQHLLSATFQDELGMLTVSFHLGEELSTVDLATSDLDGAQATRAERRVNEIISQDREVHKRYYTPDEADELPLRKPPGAFDTIRVVSVEGLDYSACCGTHCRRTGEIGLLKIRRWERRGDQTRVEFFCGWRAWADYAWKHHDITQVANEWSIQDRKVAEAALRTAEALRESQREVERLTNELLDVEADRLVSQAEDVDGAKIVSKVFSDRDQDEVRYLALRIIAEPGQVILFGIRGGTGRLVFGRSTDLDMDMPGLLRHICGAYGGGGGGQPHLAQGGGMPAEALGEALGQARAWVVAAVSGDMGEGA
jgi:alanyl-tRNA synthetase